MQVDVSKCVGCKQCVPICIVNAISIENGKACINQDKCLECGACFEMKVCKRDALYMPELEWPRILRAQYSNPRVKHPKTNMGGRGTEEVKTNDVTGRVKCGEIGIVVEMGRPGIGTSFRDVETMAKAMSQCGAMWELANPISTLIDLKTGEILDKSVLDERVLSCLLEVTFPVEMLSDMLDSILSVQDKINTVFSLDMVSTYAPDGSLPGMDILAQKGIPVAKNAKFNLGMGRPLYKED